MTEAEVATVLREALMVGLKLGGPPLIVGLLAGIVLALLQAATQINDAAFIFVPKLLALVAVLALLGPFVLAVLTGYMTELFDRLVALGTS